MNDFENNAMPPVEAPTPTEHPLDDQRKAFKASIRPAGRTLLLFMVVQQIGAGIFIAIWSMVAMIGDPNVLKGILNAESGDSIQQATESVANGLSSSAWIMTAFTLLAYFAVVLPWRKIGGVKEDLRVHKRMPIGTGIKLTCVAVGAQLLYMLLMPLLAKLMPGIYNGMDMLDEMMAHPSSLVFASLVGPVVEELLFRGALISALKRHGKWYAILVSSILFALFHANVPQGLFAFSVGLVLGYVAIEYSIWWSIAIHVFNNFVLAQLPLLLAGREHASVASGVSGGLTLALGIAGLVIVIQKHGRIAHFLRDNLFPQHRMRWTFSQGYYLTLTIFCVGVALLMLLPR